MVRKRFVLECQRALFTKRQELEQWLAQNPALGPADRHIEPGDHVSVFAVRDQNHSQTWQTLGDIEAAFGRIEDGTYGICPDCGDEIPEERLLPAAWVKRCTNCQSNHDQTRGRQYW